MILTMRTDNSDAEVGVYNGMTQLGYYKWRADRQLAKDLLKIIHEQLKKQHADWSGITGLVVFEGPGSFTGLRIGLTVANTLAYAQQVPIVAARGDNWLADGLTRLQKSEDDTQVMPHYGAEANITKPKK